MEFMYVKKKKEHFRKLPVLNTVCEVFFSLPMSEKEKYNNITDIQQYHTSIVIMSFYSLLSSLCVAFLSRG